MGPELGHNLYHVETIRSRLTQNLGSLYPEIRDEVCVSFDEVLDLRDGGECTIIHRPFSIVLKVRESRLDKCTSPRRHLPGRLQN